MKDFVVLIQGGIDYIQKHKEIWKDHNVIFSTWKGNENYFDENDIVIFNEFPSDPGPANVNLQLITTINGLKKAKELGFKKVLKIRSDLIPTDVTKFLNLLNFEKLNFLCWHGHEVYPDCPGYLVDYLMAGEIEEMIKLWSFNHIFCLVPEVMLTWSYIENCNIDIEYFLHTLTEDNDLFWLKNNIFLSSYRNKIQNDQFKKYDFNLNKNFLKQKYLNFLKK